MQLQEFEVWMLPQLGWHWPLRGPWLDLHCWYAQDKWCLHNSSGPFLHPITATLAAVSPIKKQIECKDCFIPSKVKQKWFGDIVTFFFFFWCWSASIFTYIIWLKPFNNSLRWDYCCILRIRNVRLREILSDFDAHALSQGTILFL